VTESRPTALIIHGATGHMGKAILSLMPESREVTLAGMLELRPASNRTGTPSAGPVLRRVPVGSGDVPIVVVDFSRAEALGPLVTALTGTKTALVSGTTGLGESERKRLETYSEEAPVFYDENMSYGIAVLKSLIRAAGPLRQAGWDVEITEFHRRGKVDRPSGTALALSRVLSAGESSGGAHGAGVDVPIHSLRIGDVPGEHDVHFASSDEAITLSHRALARSAFARGALRAVRYVASKPPGLYSMADLLKDMYG
jgi:4-hydroxy-tetrahydrodipicolinate reductase